MTPLSLAILVVSPISGVLSDRIGTRIPNTAGLAILAVGLLSLTSISAETGHWGLTWRFAGVALAYLAHQIGTSNGDSCLIRAASRMVEPDGDDSRRARVLRASDEVLSPLSQALLANYL